MAGRQCAQPDAFVPLDVQEGFFFELPPGPAQTTRYGLATAIVGTDPPLFVEVVFPGGEIVFDSVLEEFTKDIAWLWLPFLLSCWSPISASLTSR